MIRLIGIAWLAGIFALLPSSVAAQRALHWERYDIAVAVGLDGSLRVEETQRIVIDEGTFRTGSRSFTTGSFGRVRSVAVSEDGQPYVRGAEGPGTFSASDDGERFQLSYVFRDPTATEHLVTISYVIAQSLTVEGDEAVLAWNFFCADEGCPEISTGSLTFTAPAGAGAEGGVATATGAPVRASRSGSRWQWELSEPIQGTQIALAARFPRAALGSSAVFRSVNGGDGSALQPDDAPFAPDGGIGVQPADPTSILSPVFCVVGLFIVIIALSAMSSAARGRGVIGGPRTPGFPMPPMMGGYGFPRQRRWGRWGRGRAGGYGGWGVPPIIPPPIIPPPFGDPTPWDGGSSRPFPSDRADDTSGGGGFSWDNSGGGGSSWGDSGGGGASWGDSGGGGSSWGGGGDSGGGGGGGGGGSKDSSSFN